jgi:hypothetical protein
VTLCNNTEEEKLTRRKARKGKTERGNANYRKIDRKDRKKYRQTGVNE